MSKNRIDKSIDEIDIKIIDLMILNKNNKQIPRKSSEIPLYCTKKS